MPKRQIETIELSSDSNGCNESESETGSSTEDSPHHQSVKQCKSQQDVRSEAAACKLVEGGPPLRTLKVVDLRTYLRCKGLRVSGSKAELVGRVHEFLKLSRENLRKLFPKHSFSKVCTGDVCKGDIVLFEHLVYGADTYDIEMRGSLVPPLGKRTVAARVVSESYGALKQQHTFTLEALWSDGPLPVSFMHQLKIKGRNLYRIKTMRQPWHDENERHLVLNEKHTRGEAARAIKRQRTEGWRHGSRDRRHATDPRREKHRATASSVFHPGATATRSSNMHYNAPQSQEEAVSSHGLGECKGDLGPRKERYHKAITNCMLQAVTADICNTKQSGPYAKQKMKQSKRAQHRGQCSNPQCANTAARLCMSYMCKSCCRALECPPHKRKLGATK